VSNKKNAEAWKEAKKRCRLNEADIQMAKELGMSPKSLIKNIPSRDQKWKAPVKMRISDLYEKKIGKVLTVKPALNKVTSDKKKTEKESMISVDLDDLQF
jgi:hypothetical protein